MHATTPGNALARAVCLFADDCKAKHPMESDFYTIKTHPIKVIVIRSLAESE
jgi:hypothetical protein